MKLRSSSSAYKGIVAQCNGRWGAQLYEDNKRIWVGTFDNQELAARAYDMAAIRYRGHQTVTNFPIYDYTLVELDLIDSFSKTQLLHTLRTNTFKDELARFTGALIPLNLNTNQEWLFHKVLTTSDIGKHNRLVVPTKFAKKYFPAIAGEGKEGLSLIFKDAKKHKVWKFKYNYWSSTQIYVFTKGWAEFVKDRGLSSGDVVRFYSSLGGVYIDSGSNPPISDGCRAVEDELGRVKTFRLFGVDLSSQ